MAAPHAFYDKVLKLFPAHVYRLGTTKKKKKHCTVKLMRTKRTSHTVTFVFFTTIQRQSVNAARDSSLKQRPELIHACFDATLTISKKSVLVLLSLDSTVRDIWWRSGALHCGPSVNLCSTAGNPRPIGTAAALSPSCADGLIFILVSGLKGKCCSHHLFQCEQDLACFMWFRPILSGNKSKFSSVLYRFFFRIMIPNYLQCRFSLLGLAHKSC